MGDARLLTAYYMYMSRRLTDFSTLPTTPTTTTHSVLVAGEFGSHADLLGVEVAGGSESTRTRTATAYAIHV